MLPLLWFLVGVEFFVSRLSKLINDPLLNARPLTEPASLGGNDGLKLEELLLGGVELRGGSAIEPARCASKGFLGFENDLFEGSGKGAASPGDDAREKLRCKSAILLATPDPSLPFFETTMASSFCFGILLRKLPAGDRGIGETDGKDGVRRVKDGVLSALLRVVELTERKGRDGCD